MKNKIVYGDNNSEITEYFLRIINTWEGKTIAISNKIAGIHSATYKKKDFKLFINLMNLNEINFTEILEKDNTFIFTNLRKKELTVKTIGDLIICIKDNLNNINKPLLVAFDEFTLYNLSEKRISSKSLLLELLELENVYTFLAFQDLKILKKIYREEYSQILDLCDIVCTKEYEDYSGELRVRFPKSLHKYLVEEAAKEGISLNQYIAYQLTKNMVSNKFNQIKK